MNERDVFDLDTAVEPLSEHVFRATLTDRWNTFAGPNGGYLLAICVRALTHEVPFPDPLVVSGHFLRPPTPGVAEVHTERVRAGRRHASAQASLFQSDKETLRVVATFTDLQAAQGRTLMLAPPPALPPPEQLLDPLAGASLPGVTIAERVEARLAAPPGWMTGQPSGEPSTEFWMRLRGGRDADPLALTFLVDAAPPTVMEIGEFVSSTVEMTVHVRARPAPGWLACRSATRFVGRGYHEEDMEIWDSDGQFVAQSRQLALLA